MIGEGSGFMVRAAAAPLRGGFLAMLKEDVACVLTRDPAARGWLECLILYPGFHAILWHRIAHYLWIRKARTAARFVSWLARFLTNVDIHPAAVIGRRFFIDHGAGVVIGETAKIGDDVTLYHGVTLGGTSWRKGKRHPTLGDGVLVGAGAKILGPVTIGNGARVGANSVVIEDVADGATVVGIPARMVRERHARRRLAGGRVDLEHHLMPDPVGEALSLVLDRLDFLEARLSHTQERLRKLQQSIGREREQS